MKIWDILTLPARFILWLLAVVGTLHLIAEFRTWFNNVKKAQEEAVSRLEIKYVIAKADKVGESLYEGEILLQ